MGALGGIASEAPGRGRGAKKGAAPGADESASPLSGNPGSATQAAPWEEQIQQVSAKIGGYQSSLCAFTDSLITFRDGFLPHHLSKETAPCCTSISKPSAARIPKSRAASTKGVGPER